MIPTLKLKKEFAEKFEIGVSDDKLATLVQVSRALDNILDRAPGHTRPMSAGAPSSRKPASTRRQ